MMVIPKKHLGQHFLIDDNIAKKISNALQFYGAYEYLVEVGPGTGALTKHLIKKEDIKYYAYEMDEDSVIYLKNNYPEIGNYVQKADFLKANLYNLSHESIGVIGNFPYNISSQIFFQILAHKSIVKEVVCMIQREVGERIVSEPNSKRYGILSVLLQTFFEIEILRIVKPTAFHPPPKVDSAVLRFKRNDRKNLDCSEPLFRRIVKEAFQKRRKTLRNALKGLILDSNYLKQDIFNKRAEQLSVKEFIEVTQSAEKYGINYKL